MSIKSGMLMILLVLERSPDCGSGGTNSIHSAQVWIFYQRMQNLARHEEELSLKSGMLMILLVLERSPDCGSGGTNSIHSAQVWIFYQRMQNLARHEEELSLNCNKGLC